MDLRIVQIWLKLAFGTGRTRTGVSINNKSDFLKVKNNLKNKIYSFQLPLGLTLFEQALILTILSDLPVAKDM